MFRCAGCGTEYEQLVEICEECQQEIQIEKIEGPELIAISAVTAHLEKVDNRYVVKVGKLWNLSNDVANEFIIKIEAKFRRKNKFHNFLTKDELPYSMPALLKKYIAKNIVFKKVAQSIMERIKSKVVDDGRLGGVTDNNVVFVHYKTNGDDDDFGRLLIVMVNKKSGFDFDSVVLTPKKLSPIDTDALSQAALFDLTLFAVVYPDNKGEPYVRFIEGKSRSNFFKDALGCKKDVSNSRSVDELFRAIAEFAKSNNISNPIRDKAEEAVREFLDNKAKNKTGNKTVTIKDIGKIFDKIIPDIHPAKGKFTDFVYDNEYQIDDVFEPTRNATHKASSFDLSDENKNFVCRVRRGAVGSIDSGKPVMLDRKNKWLILPLSDEDFGQLDEFAGDQ